MVVLEVYIRGLQYHKFLLLSEENTKLTLVVFISPSFICDFSEGSFAKARF